MKLKYKELLKNTSLIAIGNFSSKILIFLLIPIYTRYLSTSEYGLYDLTYTTIQLLFPILTLGITESIMYFTLKKKMKEANIFSINIIMIIISSIIFDIILVLNSIFKIFELIDNYVIYISIFYFVYCINHCLIQFSKGIDKVKTMTIAGIIGTVSMIVFNIIFLTIYKIGLTGYYVANILGLFIPSLYIFLKIKCWNYITLNNKKEYYYQSIMFSLPLIVNTLAWWVNNTADRYIITYFNGVDTNGLLSIAYKIPSILTAVGAIFIQAWQISALKESKNNNSYYLNLFFIYNCVLSLISGFLILFLKPIASIIFANDFYNAWNLVPFLIISSLFNQNSGFIGAILIANSNPKSLSISALVGIIFNIILNIIFIIIFGPIGITISTMLSSFLIYYMRNRFANNILKNERIFLSWVLLIILAVLKIKTNFVVIQIIIYLIILILYKDVFKKTFNYIIKEK